MRFSFVTNNTHRSIDLGRASFHRSCEGFVCGSIVLVIVRVSIVRVRSIVVPSIHPVRVLIVRVSIDCVRVPLIDCVRV